jgi:hypothetical protein
MRRKKTQINKIKNEKGEKTTSTSVASLKT